MFSRLKALIGNIGILTIPDITFSSFVEILILFFVIYRIVSSVRDTRAWSIFKGIVFILVFYVMSNILNLYVVSAIIKSLSSTVLIAIIVIFHNDIRQIFEKIGRKEFIPKVNLKKQSKDMYVKTDEINSIIDAVDEMSKDNTGVLMVFEREVELGEYAETGIRLNSEITKELIASIFEDKTRLHDGAMIIKDNKIEAATCYLPLSQNSDIDKGLGTRHRAAIGVTEYTDAVVVVVSEETGSISYVKNGEIRRHLSPDDLKQSLTEDLTIGSKDKDIKTYFKKLFTSNLKNKITAMLIAFLVWFSYMNIVSPPTTRSIEGIPIEVTNEDTLVKIGKTYDISKNPTTNIIIRGNASKVANVTKSDIEANIDLRKLSITNAAEVKVSIPKYPELKVEVIDKIVNVDIDDLAHSEWDIQANPINEPGKGKVFGGVDYITNDRVYISGPKKIINTIAEVRIDLDLRYKGDGDVSEYPIVIIDKNGNKVKDTNIKTSVDKTKVKINMLSTKMIDLDVNLIKDTDKDYLIKSINFKPDKVKVSGEEGNLSKINDLNILLKTSELSLEDKTSAAEDPINKYTKNILLEDYLPEDIYVSKKENTIQVEIELEATE